MASSADGGPLRLEERRKKERMGRKFYGARFTVRPKDTYS
jgi:hypothetical protein